MDNRRVSSRSRSRSLSRRSASHATATLQRLAAVGIHPVDTHGMAPSSSRQGGAPANPVGKDEGKGKGKDLRKKQRMDEAGDAIVPNSNEWYLECDLNEWYLECDGCHVVTGSRRASISVH